MRRNLRPPLLVWITHANYCIVNEHRTIALMHVWLSQQSAVYSVSKLNWVKSDGVSGTVPVPMFNIHKPVKEALGNPVQLADRVY